MNQSNDLAADPWLVQFSPEQYERLQKAAAAEGMTVKEWAINTLEAYATEQMDIEAHHKRKGFTVVEPEPDERA